jgi:hypothetical protein
VSSGRGCLRCARWIAPAFPDGSRRHALRVARGEVIEREGHIVALEIDLDRAVDRFAEAGELVEPALKRRCCTTRPTVGIKMTRPACSGCLESYVDAFMEAINWPHVARA